MILKKDTISLNLCGVKYKSNYLQLKCPQLKVYGKVTIFELIINMTNLILT